MGAGREAGGVEKRRHMGGGLRGGGGGGVRYEGVSGGEWLKPTWWKERSCSRTEIKGGAYERCVVLSRRGAAW